MIPARLCLECGLLWIALALRLPSAVTAQAAALGSATAPLSVSSSVPGHWSTPSAPHVIRWYEALAVAGGVSAAFLVDEPVQEYLQRHRSPTSDDIASVFRHVGQPEVWATTTLGLLGAGLIAQKPNLTRAGGRLATSLALSAAEFQIIKRISGRARPDSGLGAFHFDPFSGSESFPSGHVTAAFSLATSLADDIHRPWATVGLYAIATGTAFSRLNDDRHWLSDTFLGAALGTTTAKLVNGHWQIFGLHPPRFLLDPVHSGIALSCGF